MVILPLDSNTFHGSDCRLLVFGDEAHLWSHGRRPTVLAKNFMVSPMCRNSQTLLCPTALPQSTRAATIGRDVPVIVPGVVKGNLLKIGSRNFIRILTGSGSRKTLAFPRPY